MNFKKYMERNNVRIESSVIRKILGGKKIRILDSTASHDYGPVGSIVVLNSIFSVGSSVISGARGNGTGNNLNYESFELVGTHTLEDIVIRIAEVDKLSIELAAEKGTLIRKLAKMEEEGVSEIEEDEWKLFEIITVLNRTDRSDLQKAKAIVESFIS